MPSGLAIGEGLARGFDNASKNFLASMKAVQDLKIEREKFDIDKKVSKLQLQKLEYDLDPVQLASQKRLMDANIKSLESFSDLRIAKAEEARNKIGADYNSIFRIRDEIIKSNPSIEPDLSFTIPIGAGGAKMTVAKSGDTIPTIPAKEKQPGWFSSLFGKKPSETKPKPTPIKTEGAKPDIIEESSMPDPLLYSEGTIIEDDESGESMKLVDGEWVKLEDVDAI